MHTDSPPPQRRKERKENQGISIRSEHQKHFHVKMGSVLLDNSIYHQLPEFFGQA
jgi:hypothetical protein